MQVHIDLKNPMIARRVRKEVEVFAKNMGMRTYEATFEDEEEGIELEEVVKEIKATRTGYQVKQEKIFQ